MDTLNRLEFVDRIDREYDAYFDGAHVIGYLHIHRMKYYNRLHGIAAGDEVLHTVIELLGTMAAHGLVARYAGDGLTFVVSAAALESLPRLINAMLPTYGEVNGLEAKLGTIVCRHPLSVDDAMRRALFACNSIEEIDGCSHCAFEGETKREYDKRSYIIDHLDDAIASGEIQAWAQPIVRVITGMICEVETLARWKSERYGFLYPDEFVPVLEDHQLIHKLDLEVIRLVCSQWAEARDKGTNVPFGINLSRLDFELCDIYSSIRAIMQRYDVPVDQVHVEITESSAVQDDDVMSEGVRRFRAAGFQVYMDDFGSGYSSLGQMADLRFDVIKFDKGMIDHVEDNERARAVLADTISMVKRLGMQTLCEGVETQEQLEFLRAVGCEKAQGYLFGKPAAHETTMSALHDRSLRHEDLKRGAYLDAVGQVNLMEGTSASIHGVEAAAFLGRQPVAVLEVEDGVLRLLTSNIAFRLMVERMGVSSFDELAAKPTKTARRIYDRAIRTGKLARETGAPQTLDFIAGGVFCSATMVFVAQVGACEAFLTTVTSVERAPEVTEHSLLMGLLATGTRCYFWKDMERRFLGANQQFLDYYGFEGLDAILGKTDEDMGWHEENQPFHDDEVNVLEGMVITDAHGVCLCRGEYRDIIASKRPLYYHGTIVGLVGYFEDIGPHRPA